MPEQWYEVVEAGTRITQGDIITECPVMVWKAAELTADGDNLATLRGAAEAVTADVIVMTQACDLEQSHVENVILCPHSSLADYRKAFEDELRAKGQNPTEKAWRRHCDDIKDGFAWNLSMLNPSAGLAVTTDHRIVDFSEVFTVPRTFIESFLKRRGTSRLSLLPPYREHLSQAFARYFMRVGLPEPIVRAW